MTPLISQLKSESFFVELNSDDRKSTAKVLSFVLPLLILVILWDRFTLNSTFTLSYVLIKGSTISVVAATLYFSHKNIKGSKWTFLSCIFMFLYSFYGLVFIDFTYCYSFLEMYLATSFFFRISKKAYLTVIIFGALLNIAGLIMASEPNFIQPGMSFKPHIGIVSFIFYLLSLLLFFNVTKRKEELFQLQEKFASIGRQSSYIFHEIKKPINRLLNSDSLHNDDVQHINNIFLNIELMLKNPANFKSSFRSFNLKTTLTKLSEEFDPYFKEYNITYSIFEDDLILTANEALLRQVFKNLIINAVEAIMKTKQMEKTNYITIKHSLQSTDKKTTIHFHNTGSSISALDKDKIFDPFYSTKNTGLNHGLGLAFCRNIIEGHEGAIKAVSEKDGTAFIITI